MSRRRLLIRSDIAIMRWAGWSWQEYMETPTDLVDEIITILSEQE